MAPPRPPFGTDEPESIYETPNHPQRRIRQPAPVDPNSRTSAYNVYNNYIHDDSNRQSGIDALGAGFMNGSMDDDDDEPQEKYNPFTSAKEQEASKHAMLAAAIGPRKTPTPPPQYIASPRPGYAASVEALSRPEPAAIPATRQPPNGLSISTSNNPFATPMDHQAFPNGPHMPQPIAVPNTPHPLQPPMTQQLPDLLSENLFCEPTAKDSMAAIGLAAAILAHRDPDAVIGSFAADHMISGDDAFLAAVAEAVEVARNDYLVTIGIAPSHPSTGFGYIRLGEPVNIKNAPNARLVSSFKEKPDARTAASYIATGKYRWNAGMFVMKATTLLKFLEEYKPEMSEGLRKIGAVWDDEKERNIILEKIWPELEKIPIDNAVAEPAAEVGRVAVVPATFGWDDVGDFSSLSDLLPAEANQPRVLGDPSLVLTDQVAGGIVVPGSGRLISCLGVDDLVIVDMPDCLLVTTRARSQEVKRIVKKARDHGWKKLL